jgi:alcohol dehydrogenase, propanol-preferring
LRGRRRRGILLRAEGLVMRAMALAPGAARLEAVERDPGAPGPGEVRLRVLACGVCRTDLHVVDRELPGVRDGIVPGHEVVGVVEALGPGVAAPALGARVGVPWLGGTCGVCGFCRRGAENLCDAPVFTGLTRDGGYAERVVARADYVFPLPEGYGDAEAAPLLCAGLIGFRALRMAGEGAALGIYGFGAAAHIAVQVARAEGRRVHAFTRPGDAAAQAFALRLGAASAQGSNARPPEPLDAAIIFAPVGALVPAALAAVRKGGAVVCGGIHMSDIPAFPYALLWGERRIVSVANLTRADAVAFLALAPRVPVRTEVEVFPLAEANAALERLRAGRLSGAAVLVP